LTIPSACVTHFASLPKQWANVQDSVDAFYLFPNKTIPFPASAVALATVRTAPAKPPALA
jgi:hypothetical protein